MYRKIKIINTIIIMIMMIDLQPATQLPVCHTAYQLITTIT